MRPRPVPLAFALFLAACTTGDRSTGPRLVDHVDVTPAAATLDVGGQLQLTATPRDRDGDAIPGRTVIWASSASAVAEVSSTGLVDAVAEGAATITATADGKRGTALVTVNPPPAPPTITLRAGSDSLAPGSVVQVVATVKDGAGTPLPDAALTWQSSQPAIATVTPSGLVTALQLGTVRLVALALGESASVDLAVRPNAPRSDVTPVPLMDLLQGTYVGFQGGLYPGGEGTPPPAHHAEGVTRARTVVPRNTAGQPDPAGKYVLLSIGMSNATQEWCVGDATPPCDAESFMGKAAADPAVETTGLVIANGAKGGQVAHTWSPSTAFNYDRVRDSVLAPLGLTESQVQAIWFKLTDSYPASPTLPAAGADALELVVEVGNALRAMRTRYPNLQLVFLASRTYGGYATLPLNPEPYAFEGGLAAKWVIEAQIRQMQAGGTAVDPRAGNLDYRTTAPWVGWGPYLWARGTTPRSDGLVWERSDFEADATHPSLSGVAKVGNLLLAFFKSSPYAACWFLAGQSCP